jgi:hypothetical protein
LHAENRKLFLDGDTISKQGDKEKGNGVEDIRTSSEGVNQTTAVKGSRWGDSVPESPNAKSL